MFFVNLPLLLNLPGSASDNRVFSGYKVGTSKDGTAGTSVLFYMIFSLK